MVLIQTSAEQEMQKRSTGYVGMDFAEKKFGSKMPV
jgi:hypothetical protein